MGWTRNHCWCPQTLVPQILQSETSSQNLSHDRSMYCWTEFTLDLVSWSSGSSQVQWNGCWSSQLESWILFRSCWLAFEKETSGGYDSISHSIKMVREIVVWSCGPNPAQVLLLSLSRLCSGTFFDSILFVRRITVPILHDHLCTSIHVDPAWNMVREQYSTHVRKSTLRSRDTTTWKLVGQLWCPGRRVSQLSSHLSIGL